MQITTEYVEQINRTPAVALATEGHADLFARGMCDAVTQVAWNNGAIIARVDGELAGVITFTHTKWAKQIDISIGYVRERFRRTGVYRAMWEALVDQARALGAVQIQGNTHIDNTAMRATAARLGRVERGVMFGFDVLPAPPATL